MYQLRPSREHAGWAGILLLADDPWWQTIPPNGWGCKCHVRQLSHREAERLKAAGQVIVQAPDLGEREYVNKRTGEVQRGPVGIEPGWAYNPGAGRNSTE